MSFRNQTRMREFKTTLRIDGEHLDQYGHVNYRSLPLLYEIAQDRALEECGLSFQGLETKYGLRSFVRRTEADYFDQLFEGDDVLVTTSVNIRNTSMIFDQYMEKGQKRTSQLKLIVVTVDSEGRKTAVPDDIKEAFKV